ncbi:G-protein coupled receptor Mth2-like isoform X2 [Choristoneura fumiferana]|uniref:G-protein coupled receptor Mth2-like isoform X2 n=1 Tax=Choristoneura fumiferana TaxID=7141 RepID=UPI003D153F52
MVLLRQFCEVIVNKRVAPVFCLSLSIFLRNILKMSKLLIVLIQVLLVCSVSCEPCPRVESVDITSGVTYTNGSIIHEGTEYTSGSWYEIEEKNETITLGCPCLFRNCLWKCCNSGQAFSGRNCTDVDLVALSPFSPPMFKDTEPLDMAAREHFFYMYNNSLCIDRYLIDTNNDDEHAYVQQNGSMLESVGKHSQWHKPGSYCMDMMLLNDTTARLIALVCHPSDPITDDSKVLYIMYAVGLLLSAPFLLVTFLVYAFIPELRNLHGMCLMAYCAGLIMAYPFLAYLKMHSGTVGVGKTGCIVIAFIVYYAFQTSFFWLNVMCFDIWRTFRSATPIPTSTGNSVGYRGGSSKKRQEQRRFAMYGAYAWGVPLLLTGLTAFMQFGNLPDYIMKPGLGDMKCWFEDWQRDLLYFFTPVLILVVCNTVLFSVTAHRIRSIKQETAILKGSESARSDRLKKDKQRYGLYLKLFMVMGVNWTVELISFGVGGSNWYWAVIDLSNIMLGFFIFLIFVWKKKVRNLVKKRWQSFRGTRTMADSSLGKWATRTSSAPTEDTRVSSDETALRMKEVH